MESSKEQRGFKRSGEEGQSDRCEDKVDKMGLKISEYCGLVNVPRYLMNGPALQLSGWTATGKVMQGCGRPAQQQSPVTLNL